MKTITVIGKDCVGCRSCEQSCPKKCIAILENIEGFLYPVIDDEACVKCGMCLKKCPVSVERKEIRKPLEIYAFKARVEKEIFHSASGGVSDVAVKAILARNGVAYGAAYDDELVVCHIEVIDNRGRELIQSSKYVQSNLGDTFSKAMARLQKGEKVLFTGTPCQIAGLHSFLGRDYDNLFTIDLICHGVPSPKLLSKYLIYQEKQLGERVETFNFRAKDKRGWGTQYLLKTKTKTKTKTRILSLDKYGKHFMDGDCYRESCYQCRYANINRPADLTVGDFWGIERSHPDFSSPMGVSSVFVNTEKGQKLLEWMKNDADVIPATLEEALVKQVNLVHPTHRPNKRDSIYRGIDEDDYIDRLHVGLQAKERIKALLPRSLVTVLKRKI